MSLIAGDFDIVPTVVGKDDCHMTVTHKWTGTKWTWRGKEADWAEAGPKLFAQIEADLDKKLGTTARPLPGIPQGAAP